MIVRILTDNQYRLDDQHGTAVDALDEQLVAAMKSGDSAAFDVALQRLVALIHDNGTLVGMEEVLPSDVIVPAPDMSLSEANQLLAQAEVRFPARKTDQTH